MLLTLAILTLLLLLGTTIDAGIGNRRIGYLRDIPPVDGTDAPQVSVVIAARNEERGIREALDSVLRQDYPALEVIVVDDRSTDSTGAILDEMTAQHPRLRLVHLAELPGGWLGKNHALHSGAAEATGEFLLFTDADVVMAPSTLARAVGYVIRERIDHLALAPELDMPNARADLFAGVFAVLFAQYARPWKAPDPDSPRHIGVGAFNLVRAAAYHAVGGHSRIAMRPDDDLKLGKILKGGGFRQDLLFGRGAVRVEWYASLGEAIRGLEKNSFAALEYSVPAVIGVTLMLLAIYVWPFAAVLLTGGLVRALNAAVVALLVAIFAGSTRVSGANPFLGLAFPVGILLLVFALWRSMLLALRNGGIRWRDTLYPLDELRENRL